MNAVRKYEKLRLQLIDLADLLDDAGLDVLSAAAQEAAATMREGIVEAGISTYREWYARNAAAHETDAEIDEREAKR